MQTNESTNHEARLQDLRGKLTHSQRLIRQDIEWLELTLKNQRDTLAKLVSQEQQTHLDPPSEEAIPVIHNGVDLLMANRQVHLRASAAIIQRNHDHEQIRNVFGPNALRDNAECSLQMDPESRMRN